MVGRRLREFVRSLRGYIPGVESRRCLHSGGPDGAEMWCLHSGGPDGAENWRLHSGDPDGAK